jgi:hypothetical protein
MGPDLAEFSPGHSMIPMLRAAAADTGWPPYVWMSKKMGIFSAISTLATAAAIGA